MKSKTISLVFLSIFTFSGSASAMTVLLSDNFNTVSGGADVFNNDLATTQGGSLATIGYTTNLSGGPNHVAQHGNGNQMLLAAIGQGGGNNVYSSLNHNFATDANSANQVLEIKFNLTVNNTSDASWWSTIAISGSQNNTVNSGANQFSSLFRDNGATQQFGDGVNITGSGFNFTDGDLITLTLSDTAGTGSAFNGNGSVAKIYVNNVLQNTWTDLGLGAGDGFISFEAKEAFGYYDNLQISTIPEPSVALLSGFAILGLLRRRR